MVVAVVVTTAAISHKHKHSCCSGSNDLNNDYVHCRCECAVLLERICYTTFAAQHASSYYVTVATTCGLHRWFNALKANSNVVQ
jgi:hypothetical protein